MTLELTVAVMLAVVAGVARWHVCRTDASPLGQANAALERGRQRRAALTPLERWHAFEWLILALAVAAFIGWAILAWAAGSR